MKPEEIICHSKLLLLVLLSNLPNKIQKIKHNSLGKLIEGCYVCSHSRWSVRCRRRSEKLGLCKYARLCISMHTSLSRGTNRLTEKPSLVTSNPQLLPLLLFPPLPVPYCSLPSFSLSYILTSVLLCVWLCLLALASQHDLVCN